MKRIMRYVGMDVHAETIAIAMNEDGTEREVGVIANRPEAIRKCLRKLGQRSITAAADRANEEGSNLLPPKPRCRRTR